MAAAARLPCCSSSTRQNATDAAPRYPTQCQRKCFFQISTGDCRLRRPRTPAVRPELSTK